MERFQSLLYIGAGTDIASLSRFFFVNTYVLIDGLPMCEYGDPEPLLYSPYTPETWYKADFIQKLFDQLGARFFKFEYTKTFERQWFSESKEQLYGQIEKFPFVYPTLIKCTHFCEKNLEYYVSSPFSTQIPPEIANAVRRADAVFIKGHVPDKLLADYCSQPKTWFIYENFRGQGIYQENNILEVIWRAGDTEYKRLVKKAYEVFDNGKMVEIGDVRYFLL